MPSSIIRGKHIICKTINRHEVEIIDNGAVFQRDGRIVDIGSYEDIAARYDADTVVGSSSHVVLPGFVNSHHHVGLTPLQLGSLDFPLEQWFATRMACRNVNFYLDTLYSAFEMIESGITTVQHIHGWRPGPASTWPGIAEQILKAYQDIGMRVAYCFGLRDQNRLVYEPDEDFANRLPEPLASDMRAMFKSHNVPVQDYMEFFEYLWKTWDQGDDDRIHIQLAPANLHWCSDKALEVLLEYSKKYQVGMHMHLLETAYQREYAYRRTGKSAVKHLNDIGFLGEHLTLGHGVWLNEEDIELVADSGTMICHNASSNLRLQSGIAPLNEYAKRGVKVGMGLDEAGINDDRDMLQEMRMVLKLHRVPGIDAFVPTAGQVLQMATEHGAATTGFAKDVGTLEVGKAADMVLINWDKLAFPYLDELIPVIEAVIHRSKTTAVDAVMVGGEVVYQDGKFTRIDKDAILQELAESLKAPFTPEELRMREMAKEVEPYVKKFYEGWLDHSNCNPFYCQSHRH